MWHALWYKGINLNLSQSSKEFISWFSNNPVWLPPLSSQNENEHKNWIQDRVKLFWLCFEARWRVRGRFTFLRPWPVLASLVPPIGPIQPPVGNQHPPYGAAYGWRYPPGLRLCFNSHDGHGSAAMNDFYNFSVLTQKWFLFLKQPSRWSQI